MKCYLQAVNTIGPGFKSWENFCDYIKDGTESDTSFSLPHIGFSALIKRRTTDVIRLALSAGLAICDADNDAFGDVASVFATSQGDTDIMNYLGNTLATEPALLSPTKFHNSLHNAPSGYWNMLQNNQQSTTVITAGLYTFAVGLLEAVTFCLLEQQRVLLVIYDKAVDNELKTYIPIQHSFAAALLLSPQSDEHAIASINVEITSHSNATQIELPELNKLMQNNPSAKGLPLLVSIAKNEQSAEVVLDLSEASSLRIQYEKI